MWIKTRFQFNVRLYLAIIPDDDQKKSKRSIEMLSLLGVSVHRSYFMNYTQWVPQLALMVLL